MIGMITEKKTEINVTEKVILQIPEKIFKEDIEDKDNFAQHCRNIQNFLLEHSGKTGLELVQVRYKDNEINSGIIEIEGKRSTQTIKTE